MNCPPQRSDPPPLWSKSYDITAEILVVENNVLFAVLYGSDVSKGQTCFHNLYPPIVNESGRSLLLTFQS